MRRRLFDKFKIQEPWRPRPEQMRLRTKYLRQTPAKKPPIPYFTQGSLWARIDAVSEEKKAPRKIYDMRISLWPRSKQGGSSESKSSHCRRKRRCRFIGQCSPKERKECSGGPRATMMRTTSTPWPYDLASYNLELLAVGSCISASRCGNLLFDFVDCLVHHGFYLV